MRFLKPTACANEPKGEKVYVIPLHGKFFDDFDFPPVMEAIADAHAKEATVILFDIDSPLDGFRGTHAEYSDLEGLRARAQMYMVYKLGTALAGAFGEARPRQRLAAWVHRATGFAGVIPFLVDSRVYAPDAQHGAIVYARGIVSSSQRELMLLKAREVIYPYLGRLMIEHGAPYQVVGAMTRSAWPLSYNIKDEAVELEPDDKGQVVLSDGGVDAFEDPVEDQIALRGNDTIILCADTAHLLGVSRGTAATLDEALRLLGLDATTQVDTASAGRILREWKAQRPLWTPTAEAKY